MPNASSKLHRLEPRPRSDRIEENLAAKVRDSLWFLARQWQFGEFNGEDAASPVYVDLKTRFYSIDGWKPTDAGSYQKYDKGKAPLEARITAEPFTPDWATSVELGQRFEALLEESDLGRLIEPFRREYPVPSADDDEIAEHDRELRSFLLLCAGRAIDGVKLYEDARDNLSQLPGSFSLPENQQSLSEVLKAFVKWVKAVYGDFGEVGLRNFSENDPEAWSPERLEYRVEVSAAAYDENDEKRRPWDRVQLNAYPERDGTFDWYTFDQKRTQSGDGGSDPLKTVSMLPNYVRFSGMPNKRWWQFENRLVHFPSIQPDVVELSKIILVDFMLVYSNDWFVIPFKQEVGTVCRVDSLEVYDVFDGRTKIRRAEEVDRRIIGELQYNGLKSSERWSMFSLTGENGGELADFFIMPPSAAATTLTGEPLEETRFIRDEMANTSSLSNSNSTIFEYSFSLSVFLVMNTGIAPVSMCQRIIICPLVLWYFSAISLINSELAKAGIILATGE